MTTAHSYPLPIGVTASFSNLGQGQTSPNFKLTDPGLYTITINFNQDTNYDLGGGSQGQFQSSTGPVGLVAGTNTVLITMAQSGYYSFAVPPGGGTYNFTTASGCKMSAITRNNSVMAQ